jgi:hypothetical protein
MKQLQGTHFRKKEKQQQQQQQQARRQMQKHHCSELVWCLTSCLC